MSDIEIAVEVLYKQSNIAIALMLMDDYMQRVNKLGKQFKLPRGDAWMLPILERFAYDLQGYVKFVRAVCDDWADNRAQRAELVKFYRTLVVRAIQQMRRDRLGQALAWLDRHHPGMTVKERQLWLHKVEQQWKLKRLTSVSFISPMTLAKE